MTLVDDTQAPVDCTNDRCSDYDHLRDSGGDNLVAAGATTSWNHEDCGREPVGIVDPHGKVLGCIILPAADPPKILTWRASRMITCTGPIG